MEWFEMDMYGEMESKAERMQKRETNVHDGYGIRVHTVKRYTLPSVCVCVCVCFWPRHLSHTDLSCQAYNKCSLTTKRIKSNDKRINLRK